MTHPLPEIISFMKYTAPPNWTYCEKYIKLNGVAIKKSLPLQQRLTSDSCAYENGILIQRVKENIVFISYTVLEGVCVFSHESLHNEKGDVLNLSINMFYDGIMNGVDHEGIMYLKELLGSLIKLFTIKQIEWDIVKTT